MKDHRGKQEIPPKNTFYCSTAGKDNLYLQNVCRHLNFLITTSSGNRGRTAGERTTVLRYFFLALKARHLCIFHSLMFTQSAFPRKQSNPMFGERHTKDSSPLTSNFWTRRSVLISQPFGDWSWLWNGEKQERALIHRGTLESKVTSCLPPHDGCPWC